MSPHATTAQATAFLVVAHADHRMLAEMVNGLGFQPVHVVSAESMPRVEEPVGLCLVDLRGNGEALRAVRLVRSHYPGAVVIGVADPERPTASAEAIRAGVFDVLPRPASARDLDMLLANAREQRALTSVLDTTATLEKTSYGLVGSSRAMRAVMELVARAAPGRCGILICGERGTGREMIARAIHECGPHRDAPFVKVDCANRSPDELDLEVFGALGTRTPPGAPEGQGLERITRVSRLHDALGGTLFLEHLTEMPARVQARLARVLRDREVFTDAGRHTLNVDVRPVASVDTSLEAALDEGRLRTDLYDRLALVRLDVPPLRMRREDIPLLATHFLKELCRANDQPIKTLTRPALTLLSALPWKGNAPELRGLLERLTVLVPNGLVRLEDVLAHTQLDGTPSPMGCEATLRQARARFERDYIAAVLQHHHGRIAEAARVLGIQRTNLYRKMRRLNLMRGKTMGRDA